MLATAQLEAKTQDVAICSAAAQEKDAFLACLITKPHIQESRQPQQQPPPLALPAPHKCEEQWETASPANPPKSSVGQVGS